MANKLYGFQADDARELIRFAQERKTAPRNPTVVRTPDFTSPQRSLFMIVPIDDIDALSVPSGYGTDTLQIHSGQAYVLQTTVIDTDLTTLSASLENDQVTKLEVMVYNFLHQDITAASDPDDLDMSDIYLGVQDNWGNYLIIASAMAAGSSEVIKLTTTNMTARSGTTPGIGIGTLQDLDTDTVKFSDRSGGTGKLIYNPTTQTASIGDYVTVVSDNSGNYLLATTQSLCNMFSSLSVATGTDITNLSYVLGVTSGGTCVKVPVTDCG